MSLAVRPDTVEAVLLADGWHEVWGGSFELDLYEFVHGEGGVPGFKFESIETGPAVVSGPLTSVLAIRCRK